MAIEIFNTGAVVATPGTNRLSYVNHATKRVKAITAERTTNGVGACGPASAFILPSGVPAQSSAIPICLANEYMVAGKLLWLGDVEIVDLVDLGVSFYGCGVGDGISLTILLEVV